MYYVVRNELGEKTIIYPWRNGFIFVQPEHGYLPKPQSKSKYYNVNSGISEKEFAKKPWEIFYGATQDKWFLKDGFWYEICEIKPKAFYTVTRVSIVKFDNVSLKDAIGSCFCEMDAYINTYPEAFIIDKGAETKLNMEANK